MHTRLPMRSILTAERTALNFLQHLSGVATLTRNFVDAVAGLTAKILDTRKTLPGWRLLAKYAVRCGGGHNHRLGLCDGILIKDNHLAALPGGDARSRIAEAIRLAKAHAPGLPVEVEVDSLEQLDAALELCGFEAYAPDHQVEPIVRGEFAPRARVLLELETRHLNRA